MADIKLAYYTRMRDFHPDRAGGDTNELCSLLNSIYEVRDAG